jgi:hypothetical protein
MTKFLLTERGKKKLIHNGYGYVIKRFNEEGIKWVCDRKRSSKCSGYASTTSELIDGIPVDLITGHSHPPDETKYTVTAVKNILKQKAKESDVDAGNVISDVLQLLPPSMKGKLPKIKSLQKNVRNYRTDKREKERGEF